MPKDLPEGLSGAEALVAQGYVVLKAENDRMDAVAIARPRDEAKVKERLLQIIEVDPQAATSVFYSIPFKEHSRLGECTGKSDDSCPVKEWVEGISIEGAREIARVWRNNSSRVYISDEDDEWVYLCGVFLDLETNVRTELPLAVSKIGRYKSGETYILYPDKLAKAISAGVSKVARNAIVQAIPRHLSRAVYEKAKEIALQSGELALPKLLEAFAAFEVTREMLERFYQKPLEELTPEQRRNLRGLFTAFRESFLDPKEFFGGAGGGGSERPTTDQSPGEGSSAAADLGVNPPPSATAGSAKVTGRTQLDAAPQPRPSVSPSEQPPAGERPSQPTPNPVESLKPNGLEPTQTDFDGLGI